MQIDKCFFCDKIIIPLNILTLSDVKNFFKQHEIEFTLNHIRSRTKIGNKIICLKCEDDLRRIMNINNERTICEDCKQQEEEEFELWRTK